jgi:2-iminobutanoate/2-iminopropanoate deaminase
MTRFTKVVSLSAALFAAAFAVSSSAQEIVRTGEGRNFYNNILVPAGAETLYLSGSGADPLPDGSYGDMEQQTVNTFSKFKATLEEQGWSMADIVQVRVFGVAGDDGTFDFAGFNRGYQQFFGTEENPMKPVRSVVEIADLVVDGWLVEIEIRASRMPK